MEVYTLLVTDKFFGHGRRILHRGRRVEVRGLPPFAKNAKDGAPSVVELPDS